MSAALPAGAARYGREDAPARLLDSGSGGFGHPRQLAYRSASKRIKASDWSGGDPSARRGRTGAIGLRMRYGNAPSAAGAFLSDREAARSG